MGLSSDELEAFAHIARTGSFSKAARILAISQSAISQRIANLEGTLNTTLFVRAHHCISLTPAGEDLLRYCRIREQLELDVVQKLLSPKRSKELHGPIRIAAFSSVLRSAVLPALRLLLRSQPKLQLEARSAEMREMVDLLRCGEVDYILLDHQVLRPEFVSEQIGEEVNVLIEPLLNKYSDRYLDHDGEDTITERFRVLQQNPLPNAPRHFVDDVYGILDSVALGLGRGVVSAHLLGSERRVRVVEGYTPLRIPVWLHFVKQEWETPLHKAILTALREEVPHHLKPKTPHCAKSPDSE